MKSKLFMETEEVSVETLADYEGPFFVAYEVFGICASYDPDARHWMFATNGKEDAFKSYWSERRSFGMLFLDEVNALCGLDEWLGAMNPALQYLFLVPLRRRNRVLLTSEEEQRLEPTVWLAGISSSHRTSYLTTCETRAEVRGPWSFLPVLEDAEEYDPDEYPCSIGLTCLDADADETNARLVRFLLPRYADRRALRANEPDLFVRYGQLWRERSPLLAAFRKHYREWLRPFDDAIRSLLDLYQKRYQDQLFATTTPLRHAVLKKIRQIQQRKRWETITYNNIYSIVFRHFATKLYKLMDDDQTFPSENLRNGGTDARKHPRRETRLCSRSTQEREASTDDDRSDH